MSRLSLVIVALACALAAVEAATIPRLEHTCDAHSYAIRLTLSRHSAQVKNFRYCAGVRISNDWLLTAAECFDNRQHKFVRLSAPDHCDFKDKHYEIEREMLTERNNLLIKIHPKYNEKTKANNIALVKSNFVPSMPSLSSIALPYLKDRQTTYVDQTAKVYTYDADNFHTERHITVLNATVVKSSLCESAFPEKLEYQKYFCAKVTGKKAVTKDDIGAPLVFQATRYTTKKLLGIVAFSNADLGKDYPVRFTRIYDHLSWINSVTNIKLRRDAEDL